MGNKTLWDKIKDLFKGTGKTYEDGLRDAFEVTVELAEQIEREEPDGGTAEWKAFKRLRNTLREELTSLRSGGEK